MSRSVQRIATLNSTFREMLALVLITVVLRAAEAIPRRYRTGTPFSHIIVRCTFQLDRNHSGNHGVFASG